MEVDWIKPKTNWASTDKMNLEDYNRIKNNILYLKEKANEVSHRISESKRRSIRMECLSNTMNLTDWKKHVKK